MRYPGTLRPILLMGMIVLSLAQVYAQPPEAKHYRLVWSDEFDGSGLDTMKWTVRSPGKRGDAFNDIKAASLDGQGCLVIEARQENGRLVSCMLHTEGRYAARYGYFECRVKLNRVAGLWSSFWLQSAGNQTNSVPEKDGAEIDIFEYFPHARTDAVSHSIHWGGYGPTHRVVGPVYTVLTPSRDGFHVFGLLWTSSGYKVYVDGVETQQANTHVSQVPEFLILSLEADTRVAGPYKPDALPDRFVVDYVRVYQVQ
jgi:beta-glucanase (GH16 family)